MDSKTLFYFYMGLEILFYNYYMVLVTITLGRLFPRIIPGYSDRLIIHEINYKEPFHLFGTSL